MPYRWGSADFDRAVTMATVLWRNCRMIEQQLALAAEPERKIEDGPVRLSAGSQGGALTASTN